MSKKNEGIQKVGHLTLKKVTPGPTSAGIAPTYAVCTPDRWGLRYSDLDPDRKGQLAYPVAKSFGWKMKSMLMNEIQWGNTFLGSSKDEPKLKLDWPIDHTQFSDFVELLMPVLSEALTSPTAGFGLPVDAMPLIVPYNPTARGEQGSFTVNYWVMSLNLAALSDVFYDKVDTHAKAKQLGVFSNTIYHEARHCQQAFWTYALILQHPDNFEEIPNILKWPAAMASIYTDKSTQAFKAIDLATRAPIPADTAALISLKRLAVGSYLYTLNLWRSADHRTSWLPDSASLNEEYQRVRLVAADLLQHVGLGGTPIDVDAMVAEPRACAADYTGRPWENDAFVCGNTAEAYWKEAMGLLLYTNPADQCSKDYEADYIAHQRSLGLQRDSGSTTGGQ
ncbi:hypothetical protein G3N59_16470 [Paraburkholderia sp. Ac-20340]|uniref:hypothetical protein n=1 Tax=Paraburkholderia sp. Ac-20340 TaxID=2703888 RepID=UPI00197DE51D|nr:hypothetical protein [Paraburkholderia sp. Ac-20340]MBN3854978.1 hypothetical protein [Paraburkholderia sp. Ac-20340]